MAISARVVGAILSWSRLVLRERLTVDKTVNKKIKFQCPLYRTLGLRRTCGLYIFRLRWYTLHRR